MPSVKRRNYPRIAALGELEHLTEFAPCGERRGGTTLATHKSAVKRAKQSEARRLRNRARKTRVKTAVKQVLAAVENKSVDEAQAALKAAIPVIDEAASKGTLHRRTASRKISRLSKQVHALASQQQ